MLRRRDVAEMQHGRRGEGREERASRRDMEDAPGTKWQEGGKDGRTDGGREGGEHLGCVYQF
jgi:hypothetical protein